MVTDHRMAFSISTQQSVLWDQIRYSGNPSDFSWVLPVRAGTVVQASSEAWFAALDAATTPTISAPNRSCNGAGVGCGGAKGSASFAAQAGGTGGVQVISQSVVGPYDTATLKASDPRALENWLNANGYVLPPAMQPTIAAYVAGGFDFIALRLQPGLGVQAMQPVRVVTQGADLSLPLRMVAAGVGAQVGITLYVVSEGRYEAAAPFDNAVVDDSQLFWFHTQSRSNYQELSQSLMAGNGGRTWLTEFAGPVTLTSSGLQVCNQAGYYFGQSVADLYMSQCSCLSSVVSDAGPLQGLTADASDPGADGAQADDAADGAQSDDAADGARPDALAETSAPYSAPACTGDDLEVALVGLHPASVWLTRLRAIIPASALSEHDLVLQAAATQTPVSSQHATNRYDDPTYSPCGTHDGGCAAGASEPDSGPYLEVGALCLLAAAGLRRARTRPR